MDLRRIWQALVIALGGRTDAEKAAIAAFHERQPAGRIAWTRIVADEEKRRVVGVVNGDTRPPRISFFAVSKVGGAVTEIEDDEEYRPKAWR